MSATFQPGDYVVARPYPAWEIESIPGKDDKVKHIYHRREGRHFTGRAQVLWVRTEQRRDFSTGKLLDYTRVTVLCEEAQSYGFQRRDVLSSVIMPEPVKVEPVAMVKQRDMGALTRRQFAEQKYPSFDWTAYDAANSREIKVSIAKLGADRNHRRLGTETKEFTDTRSEDEKMSDKLMVQQGDALVKSVWSSRDETRNSVLAVYGVGQEIQGGTLTEAHINALAAYCYAIGASPEPSAGHVYPAFIRGKYTIITGYQFWVFKAKQQFKFFLRDGRQLSSTEMIDRGWTAEDVGYEISIYDYEESMMQRQAGFEPQPTWKGLGIWRRNIKYFDQKTKTQKFRSDNIAEGKDALWMAQKRALVDALKHLGVGLNTFQTVNVPGMKYDSVTGEYVATDPALNSTAKPELESGTNIIEGDFTIAGDEVQEVVAATPESAAAKHEPVETAPEAAETPEPAKAEESAGESGDMKTEPSAKKERPKSDRPYPPAQFKPKFQTAVNAYLASNPETKAKIKDVSVVDSWFVGIVDTPSIGIAFVKSFCEVEQLSDISQAQADILVGKILSKPEWAKTEIEQYMKAFSVGTAPVQSADEEFAKI